ncbi:MAG TPA: hypothetical protein VJ801_09945, partial [Polyangia bacterium]|nr:hypothetical protein [Polyangia bacterium]
MKPVPASPVEAQFYLSGQMHPTPALNTMTEAVAIKGPLLPQRLARALRQVSLRHAALRTRFQAVDGAIVRILDDEVP